MNARWHGWIVPVVLLGAAGYAVAEDITLTTYYPSPRGVYKELRTSGDVALGTLDTPQARVEVRGSSAGGTDKALLVASADGTARLVVQSNGAIGIGTSSPDASALLDVSSTAKGLLAPRMTKAQRDAIASPATGLLVYNTDASVKAYQVYDGTAWKALGGDSFWAAQADNIHNTNTGSVLIGTSMTSPTSRLMIQGASTSSSTSSLNLLNSAGTSMLFVRDDGRVGIRTTTPDANLDVRGNVRIVDGSQQSGRVLTSDNSGQTSWQPAYAVYAP